MKKFIIACCCTFVLAALGLYAYFYEGMFVDLNPDQPVETWTKQEGKTIYIDQGNGLEPFEIRGVDLGVGIPGHFATDYAIDKETYLRWFKQIKEMGANTIRVYILQGSAFYEAFYEYNKDNPDPLYLIHGVWIDDYVQNSHMDAFDADYLGRFKDDVHTLVDVIHGQRLVELGRLAGTGSYTKDVSPWVIGYLLGVEWEARTVAFTDMMETDRSSFEGRYMKTTADATPFEAMLAEVGNEALSYESRRYHQQRLVAFSNWATTDPLTYNEDIAIKYEKYSTVDVEHIELTDEVLSGTFASYHVYPYYPDYLSFLPDYYMETDPQGNVNTYYAYLKLLVEHHSVPVVISEFGVPTSRAVSQVDRNTNRNQGFMSESAQGAALARCYQNIMDAGCAGSIIFTWQDEWFKRTWNTMANVDLLKTPYWSDYQTNEQYFGLLSFDPGDERSVSYVDGDDEEWTDDDVIGEAYGRTLSMKYDEKFLYFMVRGSDVSPASKLYLPIDTTQKSGSTTCDDPDVSFDRAADFLMVLDGEDNSRVLVQERYEVLRATSLMTITGEDPYVDPPDADATVFEPIELILQVLSVYERPEVGLADGTEDVRRYSSTYETGKLTYGDANPAHEDFNSLADFCYGDGFVEIKIPWQLLNFSNPSEMQIHDDYYEHWGVENMHIDSMWVGVGDGSVTIPLFEESLKGWGTHVTYHERLKQGYYTVQKMWAQGVDPSELWSQDDATPSIEVIEHTVASAASAGTDDDAAADDEAAAGGTDAQDTEGAATAGQAAAGGGAQ